MNPRIRLISAKVEVGVEVETELGNVPIITAKYLNGLTHMSHSMHS